MGVKISKVNKSESDNPSVFSITQDQRDRLEDIQRGGNNNETPEKPEDLDDSKKRWIIVGICIHSILSPILRKYIESKITSLYQTLVSLHSLNTQTYPNQYQPSGLRLFYDNINNNQRLHGRQFRNYDMRVLNPVDLAKIHLPSSLAKFTGFDETCDSSALLNLLINPCLLIFSSAVRSSSQQMLTNVRNDWTHCNFDLWKLDKYYAVFDKMEALIKDLGLAPLEESKALGQLDKWSKNGHDFLSGTTLGLELVNEIKNQTSDLADYVLTLTTESETTIERLKVTLHAVKDNLSGRLEVLEKKQQITDTKTKNIENELKTLKEENTKIKGPVPCHIQAQFTDELKEWKENDKDFVLTRASKEIFECVENNPCVTITGPAGCGKTFLARHTALEFQKDGYDIINIISPKDSRDFYKPGRQTVFIVDDICGNFTASQEKIDNWLQYKKWIDKIVNDPQCKIIVSCRLQVYRDENFKCLSHFLACECNLVSESLCLSLEEKSSIIRQYTGETIDTEIVKTKIATVGAVLPLLCLWYRNRSGTRALDFLQNPFDIITEELDTLSNRKEDSSKYKICSLALCVLFNNKLDADWFKGDITEEQRSLLNNLYDACKLDKRLSKQCLQDELKTLVDTFIIKQGKKYKAIHDKVFDFLAWYFGKKITTCLIAHSDSDLIHERFRWNVKENKISGDMEYLIDISDEFLKQYIKRMVTDWSKGKIVQVFNNSNMSKQAFRQHVIRYLSSQVQCFIDLLIEKKDSSITYDYFMRGKADGSTALIKCITNDFSDMYEWLISHNESNVNQTDSMNRSLLYFACMKENLEIVCSLLKRDADLNLCDKDGQSPLWIAFDKGYVEIVSTVLEKYPNVDLCNEGGRSFLSIACDRGNVEMVLMLLEKYPNVNVYDKDGRSLLEIACDRGNVKMVSALLEKGPDVNLHDKNGRSPLWIACDQGNLVIVSKLLANNSDVNLCNNNGESPLWIACYLGKVTIVSKLFEYNPDVNLCNEIGESPLWIACYKGRKDIIAKILEENPDVNLRDKNGRSPLWIACAQGNLVIVSKLLANNSDVNLCNKNGESPLWKACYLGNVTIVSKLLEYNPDVNLCNENGESPLWIACYKGSKDIIAKLLEKDSDVNLCDKHGRSPLWLARRNDNKVSILQGRSPLWVACYDGNVENVSILLLLEQNTDVNLCDKDGLSPLLIACDRGNVEIVFKLLERELDVDFCDKDGRSPLWIACHRGNVEVVSKLLEKNPDVNRCDKDGRSPLLIACYRSNLEIVSKLLERNVDVNLCDKRYGRSPLWIACDQGDLEIVSKLLDRDPDVNLCDRNGWGPLLVACNQGFERIVLRMLEKYPDVNLCDKLRLSPLLIACAKCNIENVNMSIQRVKSGEGEQILYDRLSSGLS